MSKGKRYARYKRRQDVDLAGSERARKRGTKVSLRRLAAMSEEEARRYVARVRHAEP